MADTRIVDTVDDEDPRKSISAAPSFEEYLKQRADTTQQPTASVSAVVPPASVPAPAISSSGGSSDASSAISAMEASQTQLVSLIASAIPDLEKKPDASLSDADMIINGNNVKLEASDAPGPANIAWISDLCIDDTLSSLTIFNGPLTDVPHLISRCVVSNGDTLNFFLDFRPRAYGNYDQRDADGNYPGPDVLGRQAFEYSGARKDFDTKFGTEEVVSFFEDIKSKLEGAVDNPGLGDDSLLEAEAMTLGPLAIDVSMPLSASNVDTIISAREKAVNLWLEWELDDSHGHRPGAPVNTQYVYDSKFKINCYGALLKAYVKFFGQSEGEQLAAADSGPIDEAYVGGGS